MKPKNSPLATELFHKPYVKEVFIDENFISITKYEITAWEEIVQDLRQYLRDYIADNKAVVTGDASPKESAPQICACGYCFGNHRYYRPAHQACSCL